jgi:serine/threonine-protein kinase
VNSAPLPTGTVLGKYLLIRLIGSGGMGAVYEGTHIELRKRVAIKTLLPQLAANLEARTRFLREGEAASRIDHPHVVNVTDVGTGGEIPYLVMEFLEGENLAERLARDRGMDVPAMLDLLLPIMDGLASGHDEGVVHRDLKPHNIFLARSRDGRMVPKLLDFGVSKIMDDDRSGGLTGSVAVLGTAQYMAPEQIEGAKNVDARTDQYAMGLVLFECIAGRPARRGDSPLAMLKSVATEQMPSLRAARPDVDPNFEAVVVRALAWQPGARFSSMRELMRALLPFARPQTRLYWSEALAGRADARANLAHGFAPTMVLADSSASKKIVPSTTFGSTAGEVAVARTVRTRSRARGFLLSLLGMGVAGAVAVGVLRGFPEPPWSSPKRPAKHAEPTTPLTDPAPPPREEVRPPRPPPARRKIEIRATPPQATIAVDGFSIGRSPAVTEVGRGAHELVVSAPGFRTVTVEFADDNPLPPLIELASESPEPPPRKVNERKSGHRHAKTTPDRSPKRPPEQSQPAPSEAPARRGVNNSLILQ